MDFYEGGDERTQSVSNAVLDPLLMVCARCPVARECATFAMRSGSIELYGVWAGSTGHRRERLRDTPDAVEVILAELEAKSAAAIARAQMKAGKRTYGPRREPGPDGIVHGRLSYYRHRCRCEVCVKDRTEYNELLRRKRAVS